MASLSDISIHRPVLAIVMSLVIVIFGLIGLSFLGVREYPSVDPPVISVSTDYPGANADVIEAQITEVLEESINGIAGIKTLTSTSTDGRSNINVEFELGSDLESAANDVRDKVSRAQRGLPDDAEPPTVRKQDADAQPIIFLNISSEQRTLLQLSDIADNIFKERLQTIPGVSEVRIWGEKQYAMRMNMDPVRLASFGLTPLDVREKLIAQNVELPSGRLEGNTIELSVRTLGNIKTEEEFNNIIVKETEDIVVRFEDVGYAELGAQNERTVLKRDGVPMVGTVIVPLPGSNNIEIADEFYKRLENLKKELPADINLDIGFDNTQYIRQSINEVERTIIIAFLLVVGIIFLFFRDWRTTIIPVITIPIALIGVFFILYLAEFSINVLTLLGVVLSIGLVVDDAIVVLENIYKKIEHGHKPFEAAQTGAKEIFFAVIATTISLVAVFMPVIFLEGITGRLFREFGVVVAGSVIISSFVALSMTPMLSSKILKVREKPFWFYRVTEPFFVLLNKKYNYALESFMKVRWISFLVIALMIGGIYALFVNIQQELAPIEDRGQVSIFLVGPEGATFNYMDRYVDLINDKMLTEVPEVKSTISVTSPGFGTNSTNSGFFRMMLKDLEDRERSQQEVFGDVTKILHNISGVRAFASQPQSIGSRRGGLPVQYVIQAPTIEKLKEVLPEFLQEVNQNEMFSFSDIDLKFTKPELQISINREKARKMGISIYDIARTLQLSYSEQRFDYFYMNGKQYQVIGVMQKDDRNEPIDLKSLYVRSSNGSMIQLDNLIDTDEQSSPPSLYRFNRYISATVSTGLQEGHTIGDGIDEMDKIASRVLSEEYSTDLAGVSREFEESSSSLLFAFIFALILIYLVLAAQFESFIDPFIIMFTVPLAVAGALLTLYVFGHTLNIFSQIGIIMLIGLVTKNAILIIEFANQRKAHGKNVMDAIIEASEVRFRPILMTSLSTILGILPIALALGAGSGSRVPMGIAVIGGLIFATFLTLFVIPAIYSYLTSKKGREARM